MSLNREAFEAATNRIKAIDARANNLFGRMSLPLKDKVQMNHYVKAYLFGKEIDMETTDEELIEIIKATLKKSWDGHIDFFGEWME